MENIINTILSQYGVCGLLIITFVAMIYLIICDRKNNWGNKIDLINDKLESMDSKIEWVEEKMSDKISVMEEKIISTHISIRQEEKKEAKKQTINVMGTGQGGQLSRVLRSYCCEIGCDHIFMGLFHNGTTDLRGLHYCKFDVIIDEFSDPLKLHCNDIDFQPLYKDENVIAYGDLPYMMVHVGSTIFDLEQNDLFELSDTLYRRCKSRDVKKLGLACLYDDDECTIGFVGCVSYTDHPLDLSKLKLCARDIEKIYNDDE